MMVPGKAIAVALSLSMLFPLALEGVAAARVQPVATKAIPVNPGIAVCNFLHGWERWKCRQPFYQHSGRGLLERCGVGFWTAALFGGVAAAITGPSGLAFFRAVLGAGVAGCLKNVLRL